MKTTRAFQQLFMLAVVFVCAVYAAEAQQSTSLADVARQARAQKGQASSPSQAQQYADELAEDQSDNGAPAGFKTFNTGDYKIWVPWPYHVDGHDASGVVLSGPIVNLKVPMVMLGTGIVAHFENNDDAFEDTVLKFSHLYADQASCTKSTIANHSAYRCGLGVARLLGQHVTGHAVFVRSLGTIYPVFCVTPSDSKSRDYINTTPTYTNKKWAEQNVQQETENVKAVLQKCDTVFQSIQIPEGISAQKSAANIAAGPPVAKTSTGPVAELTSGFNEPGAQANMPPPSLQNTNSTIPPGLKVHPFNYCKRALDCYNASVLVPAGAKLVSSDCKQYVFETKVQGTSFLLLAGSDGCAPRNSNDANLVRWNELVLPETQRAPGSSSTVSSMSGTIDGKPAVITTMRFKNGLADWMSKRAEIDTNGVQLVVGCMGPREHFTDAEAMCSALIESLRLP